MTTEKLAYRHGYRLGLARNENMASSAARQYCAWSLQAFWKGFNRGMQQCV